MWNAFWNLLDRALFGPHTLSGTLVARLLRVLRYPYAIIRDLIGGELNLRATGLVYATLLSLIPALALSFAILKAFGAHRELEPVILEFFRPIGDSAPEITRRLMQFAENVRGGLVGVVGLVLLLWTLVGTVKKIEDSFNFVWRVRRARSLPRRITESLVLLIMGPLVIAAVVALSKLALDSVTQSSTSPLATRDGLRWLVQLAPYAIVTGLFTALYLLMPNTRVRLWPALVGALSAGFFWAAIGKLFTAMVLFTSRLTLVYAGFAIIAAIFLWTYLGWLILLAGAQLAFYLQNPNYLRLGHSTLRLSHSEQERLALDVMLRVGQAQTRGRAPWTVDSLSRTLALPGIAVADVVDDLVRTGLLSQQGEGPLRAARDINEILLESVVDSVRVNGIGRVPQARVTAPAVQKMQEAMERGWRDAFGQRSLADLVAESAPT